MRALHRTCCWALALALTLGTAAICQAQAAAVGRISAKTVDEEGNPVQGVKVTITCAEIPAYKHEATSNKKGKFMVSHVDGTKVYVYRFEKEGYQSMVQQVKPELGVVTAMEFVMHPPTVQASGPGQAMTSTAARAISAYNNGVEAEQSDQLDLAEEKYREALQIDPQLAAAYSALSSVAHQRGDYTEAASLAEQALAIDPADGRALQLRHEAYRLAGNTEKAAEAAEALKAAGGLADAAARIFNEAADLYNAGNLAEAKAKFLEAIDLDPSLVQAYSVLGVIFVKEGNSERAAEMASTLLERKPGDVTGLKIKYDAARQLGDTAGATEALDQLVQLDPEWAATGLFDVGVDLFNTGQNDQARVAFEKVLAVNPGNAKAHYFYALTVFANDQRTAGSHLRTFIELAPDDPDVSAAQDMLKYIPE